MKTILLKYITWYQTKVSPKFPPCCRFEPTCSEYAKQAIEKFGAWHGTKLAIKRIIRCTPKRNFNYETDRVFDPVPYKLPSKRIKINTRGQQSKK